MRQKGFAPIVLLVIIAVVAGIAVYFLKQGPSAKYSEYYKNIADSILFIAKGIPGSQPEISPTPESGTWTYINNPNHFSFQYDKSAMVLKCIYGNAPDEPMLADFPYEGADGTEQSCLDITETVGSPTIKGLLASLHILSKPFSQSLTDFVSANMNSNQTDKNQTSVGNRPAIIITTINDDETLTKVVFIEQSPTIVIKISGHYGADSKILDQILSTFKFTK